MTEGGDDWGRHAIDELRLSFEVNRRWPVDSFSMPGGEVVSHRLPGEAGALFVRYGAGQTLDAFLTALGGGLTTVTTVADDQTAVAGQPARRVTLSIRRQGGGMYFEDGPVRERSPFVLTRLVVVGLNLRGLPVLIGYRLDEDERATYEPVLERILAGVSIEEVGGAAGNRAPVDTG